LEINGSYWYGWVPTGCPINQIKSNDGVAVVEISIVTAAAQSDLEDN
jgi:hypothetical protein